MHTNTSGTIQSTRKNFLLYEFSALHEREKPLGSWELAEPCAKNPRTTHEVLLRENAIGSEAAARGEHR